MKTRCNLNSSCRKTWKNCRTLLVARLALHWVDQELSSDELVVTLKKRVTPNFGKKNSCLTELVKNSVSYWKKAETHCHSLFKLKSSLSKVTSTSPRHHAKTLCLVETLCLLDKSFSNTLCECNTAFSFAWGRFQVVSYPNNSSQRQVLF